MCQKISEQIARQIKTDFKARYFIKSLKSLEKAKLLDLEILDAILTTFSPTPEKYLWTLDSDIKLELKNVVLMKSNSQTAILLSIL